MMIVPELDSKYISVERAQTLIVREAGSVVSHCLPRDCDLMITRNAHFPFWWAPRHGLQTRQSSQWNVPTFIFASRHEFFCGGFIYPLYLNGLKATHQYGIVEQRLLTFWPPEF